MRAVSRFLFALGVLAAGALVTLHLEGRRHRASRGLAPVRAAIAETAATGVPLAVATRPIASAAPRQRASGDRILAVPLGFAAAALAVVATVLVFRLVG